MDLTGLPPALYLDSARINYRQPAEGRHSAVLLRVVAKAGHRDTRATNRRLALQSLSAVLDEGPARLFAVAAEQSRSATALRGEIESIGTDLSVDRHGRSGLPLDARNAMRDQHLVCSRASKRGPKRGPSARNPTWGRQERSGRTCGNS